MTHASSAYFSRMANTYRAIKFAPTAKQGRSLHLQCSFTAFGLSGYVSIISLICIRRRCRTTRRGEHAIYHNHVRSAGRATLSTSHVFKQNRCPSGVPPVAPAQLGRTDALRRARPVTVFAARPLQVALGYVGSMRRLELVAADNIYHFRRNISAPVNILLRRGSAHCVAIFRHNQGVTAPARILNMNLPAPSAASGRADTSSAVIVANCSFRK